MSATQIMSHPMKHTNSNANGNDDEFMQLCAIETADSELFDINSELQPEEKAKLSKIIKDNYYNPCATTKSKENHFFFKIIVGPVG